MVSLFGKQSNSAAVYIESFNFETNKPRSSFAAFRSGGLPESIELFKASDLVL